MTKKSTRPDKQVLKKFNLKITKGETVALVGPSGGGKSTTVALIERFYDPVEGSMEYCRVDKFDTMRRAILDGLDVRCCCLLSISSFHRIML
jgi:ABC-type multidrug transport system fused ATPase/permease subunit